MKKENIDEMKELLTKDLGKLILVYFALIVIFKITFIQEPISSIIRLSLSVFWLFILPGTALMYYWHDKLGFIERMVVGIALSASLLGTISYYIGFIGIHTKVHGIILPIVFIITGVLLLFLKLEKSKDSQENQPENQSTHSH